MTTAQVNYINIGFMILSGIVAFALPFELFIFSYAILGPLHYLTEMAWLRKRQFFSPDRNDYLVLIALAVVIALPFVWSVLKPAGIPADARSMHRTVQWRLLTLSNMAAFIAFATAAVLLMIKTRTKRLIAIVLIIAIAALARSGFIVHILFAIFVPTLVHVFLFTGFFILLGALKDKGTSGYLSLAVFIGCALALFVVPTGANTSSAYILDRYNSGIGYINRQLMDIFLHRKASVQDIYYSPASMVITRFIAYAYTYHYLNWFSKTSVIRWHLIPGRMWAMIIVVWAGAAALYFSNSRVGLLVLYFLSLLHVVLEFPLNWVSFREIGQHIRGRRPGINRPGEPA